MTGWKDLKNILCVRPDNMGDLLMSAPAITALKETFNCSITILTSSMAKGIAACIPAIDHVLVWDVPWVKTTANPGLNLNTLAETLRSHNFDAAVIFTVFSQSPLATAMLLTLAEIPIRLAYCRENPYQLLSHWIPDEEPYTYIRHQVRRDLDLVKTIGARTDDDRIKIQTQPGVERIVKEKLLNSGIDPSRRWLVLHPGVSEEKRRYPNEKWIEAGKMISEKLHYQIIITGIENESNLAQEIAAGIGKQAFNLTGVFSLEELIVLIRLTPLLISVNTASIHLSAAVGTSVIVLYAMTNPQHTPWKATGKVLPFSIPANSQSKNEVLRFVQKNIFRDRVLAVSPQDILEAAFAMLIKKERPMIGAFAGVPGAESMSADEKYFILP